MLMPIYPLEVFTNTKHMLLFACDIINSSYPTNILSCLPETEQEIVSFVDIQITALPYKIIVINISAILSTLKDLKEKMRGRGDISVDEERRYLCNVIAAKRKI